MRHQIQVSGKCEEPARTAPQSPASGAAGLAQNSAARALGVVRVTMLEIPWQRTKLPDNWRDLVRLVTLESKVIEHDSDETDGEG